MKSAGNLKTDSMISAFELSRSASGPLLAYGLAVAQGRTLRAAHEIMDHVSLYAIAVNEENAAGGRIVTALGAVKAINGASVTLQRRVRSIAGRTGSDLIETKALRPRGVQPQRAAHGDAARARVFDLKGEATNAGAAVAHIKL
jgi:hypothetical protein